MPLRTNIAELQRSLTSQLLLNIDVVVRHVRRFEMAVNSEDVAFLAATVGGTIDGLSRNYGGDGERRARDRSGSTKVTICGARGVERGIGQVAQEHILREGVVEEASTDSNYSLAFAGDIPRNAGAG